ncbi:endonuclease NucS domain-containing protein [Arcobacter sp. CECT 8983]|uniref:endonuclease NucS domain-containing protein n=1 Tax=Arcobacter sp. CECT 8983 TaxID=2044508 RepID=UPI0013E984F0|nr:endonuclease NucS domain-containing protein [Arcobacter sp. CECT 8983]
MKLNAENIIRDKLIENLKILDSDLVLLKKEEFLPNNLGTRGFIDILAKDSKNRYVIIELKRSKASSREALHEILKYIEGIKENKSLRNDEIQVMIVSTEWEELLVPFSSFINKTSISISGYLLEIDTQLNPISAKIVEPLELNNDRLLSDIHSIHLYENLGNLNKGVISHKKVLEQKNIDDYLLVILKASPEYNELVKESVLFSLNEVYKNFDGNKSDTKIFDIIDKIPSYHYIIYRAVQVLSEAHYYDIIKKDSEQYEELNYIKEDYEGDDLFKLLHEYALDNVEPSPYCDSMEIGYPAKFSKKLLEDEKWEIQEIIRNGKFLNNKLLTDDILIEEISGSMGTNKQKYYKEFSTKSLSSFDEITKGVKKCLQDNVIWKQGILYALQAIKEKNIIETAKGHIQIYNPSNTILSIYQFLKANSPIESFLWIPNYLLSLENDNYAYAYIGGLEPNNIKTTFANILNEYYEGNSFGLLHCMTWGGYEHRDIQISSSLGLEYANYYVEIDKKKKKKTMFKFNGFQYVQIEDVDIFKLFINFINNNDSLVTEICNFYDKHYIAPGILMSINENNISL